MDNIELKSFTDQEDNYKLMHRWCSQKFIYEWFEQRILSYDEIVNKYKNKLLNKIQDLFFIYNNDEKIGFVQIYKYDDDINIGNYNNIYEYDIFIGEESYLSKGIGTKVVNYVDNYIFNTYKSDCIVLRPFKRNIRAVKCYQKCNYHIITEYEGLDTIGNKEIFTVLIKEAK